MQPGKIKPQSSEVFEKHVQEFSWLNFSQLFELCNFLICCLLYESCKLVIEATSVHCGKGNNFGVVKFVRELSGSFYLRLQLLSQDCVLSLGWRLLLNCIKHKTTCLGIMSNMNNQQLKWSYPSSAVYGNFGLAGCCY